MAWFGKGEQAGQRGGAGQRDIEVGKEPYDEPKSREGNSESGAWTVVRTAPPSG